MYNNSYSDNGRREAEFDALDRAFSNTPDDERYIPDGFYVCVLENAEFREATVDAEGRLRYPTAIYSLCVVEGEQKGRRWNKYATLSKDENGQYRARDVSFFKKDLKILGIPPLPRELNARFAEIKGIAVKVEVRNKGNYVNTYFVERLNGKSAQPPVNRPPYGPHVGHPANQRPSPSTPQAPAASFAGTYDDDIPF